jgi:hypothetical protein
LDSAPLCSCCVAELLSHAPDYFRRAILLIILLFFFFFLTCFSCSFTSFSSSFSFLHLHFFFISSSFLLHFFFFISSLILLLLHFFAISSSFLRHFFFVAVLGQVRRGDLGDHELWRDAVRPGEEHRGPAAPQGGQLKDQHKRHQRIIKREGKGKETDATEQNFRQNRRAAPVLWPCVF